MDVRQFLQTVITSEDGWLALAYGNNGTVWREEFYCWPADADKVVARVTELAPQTNVYFSPHLLKAKSRIKENVLPTLTIAADLDNARPVDLPVPPNVLLRTSPGRHQAFWTLNDVSDLETLEVLSRKLTYATPNADHSGWPLGHMFRLPDTFNHKYLDGIKPVQVISTTVERPSQSVLELLPDAPPAGVVEDDYTFIDNPPDDSQFQLGPNQLLATYKDGVPVKLVASYNDLQSDRSAYLWALMCALFRAGASREEVYYLASHTVNNKFAGLRYHGERELAKDVLRAQGAVSLNHENSRAIIQQIRLGRGPHHEKKAQVASFIKQVLLKEGEFFHTDDDLTWYIRRDVGRPIVLLRHSDMLNVLLDIEFGLNATEMESAYTGSALASHAVSEPANAVRAAMSYYQAGENVMMLHMGRKDVLRISADNIETVTDGAHGIIFPWAPDAEAFRPDLGPGSYTYPWWEILFGDSVENVVNMSPEEGHTLLRIWLLFILMRNAAVSRPLLALFGSPGCISGLTEVTVERNNHYRTYALEDLYILFHARDRSLKTHIPTCKYGVIRYGEIADVVCSGVKRTYTVHVKGHKSFRATADHLFHTPDGYRPLATLRPGDEVTVGEDRRGRIPTAPILSIEEYGDEMTYDITMKDEGAPNFLVNGVVVHNSGKSTTFRRLYALLYGKNRALGAVTNENNFDMASAHNPLLVLDNVDTWQSWLPDRLALAASNSDIEVRKLYTNLDTVHIKRQAMIGITAHNPRFGREDVSDRMLIMAFKRLDKFVAEGEIIAGILAKRHMLWGAIVRDIQRVLATPKPDHASVPQLRVEDFAYLGQWIANGTGISDLFGNLIDRLRSGQRLFSLEEEAGLVERIRLMVERDVKAGKVGDQAPWRAPGSLWNALLTVNEEDAPGFQRQYRSAQTLSKKMLSMQEPLRAMFDVEYRMDTTSVTARQWRIRFPIHTPTPTPTRNGDA